jgi:hypothetical protein
LFDVLDHDLENEIFDQAQWWIKKIMLDFKPSREPESPTSASGG